MLDLQKASILKRISAWLLDIILLVILTVGIGALLSYVLKFDHYNEVLDQRYEVYAQEYDINLSITQEEFDLFTEEELARYEQASKALGSDTQAVYAYNMLMSLTLVIITLSLLFAYLILEFLIPLKMKHGQTIGKKIFSVAVMRSDSVKISPVILFVRTVLGKFTIETMIPVLIIMMIFFGSLGILGTIILAIILILQIVLLAAKNHTVIHDCLAHTVVVDLASQRIFETKEELVEYQKKHAKEKATKKPY